jgi:hypothetical protein
MSTERLLVLDAISLADRLLGNHLRALLHREPVTLSYRFQSLAEGRWNKRTSLA